MLRNDTGFLKYPLTAQSGGDNPTPAPGNETVFSLSTIPVRKGRKVVYLHGIMLALKADFIQSGGTGVRLYVDNFVRLFLSSFSVRDAFHGDPVKSQWYTGAFAPIVEYIACGYRRMSRAKGAFPAANATYPFYMRVFCPLSIGLGPKPHHTAQMALLYKNALFGFNMSAAAVATAVSPGSSFANVSIRATAYCSLSSEVRVGPIPEFVDYVNTSVASTNQEFAIPDFGNKTALVGVERSAGILWAGLAGNVNGLPGPLDVADITRIAVPWRDQQEISDVGAFVDEGIDVQGPQRVVGSTSDTGGAAGTLYDFSGYPFIMGATGGVQRTQELDDGTVAILPIVSPGVDVEFSKVQTVGEAVSIYITSNTNPSAGQWHLPTLQLKRFTAQKKQELTDLIMSHDEGSFARAVLGPGRVEWKVKTLTKISPQQISASKRRYLPERLVNVDRKAA